MGDGYLPVIKNNYTNVFDWYCCLALRLIAVFVDTHNKLSVSQRKIGWVGETECAFDHRLSDFDYVAKAVHFNGYADLF